MEKEAEIKSSLVIIISLLIHLVLIIGIILPVYDNLSKVIIKNNTLEKTSGGRDIIVNINEDNKRIIDNTTLLSEKDSSAKGYITRKKGDEWLNNSRDFAIQRGSKSIGKFNERRMSQGYKTGILVTDNTELIITILKAESGGIFGIEGNDEITKIPDKYSFTNENSIFYSNDGTFSFNTMKFKPFKYFKEMKDKIADHWYPPFLANSVILGYTPGRVRIMAIPNQIVKMYFTMNRNGDVLDAEIVDSLGNKSLDASCLDSIRNSKNFGKVPQEIEGDVILIRFIFIYVVQ